MKNMVKKVQKKSKVTEVGKPARTTDTVQPARQSHSGGSGRYVEGVGRRKTSVARVRVFVSKAPNKIMVNDKLLTDYFHGDSQLCRFTEDVFSNLGSKQYVSVVAHVRGGGINGQAKAVQHGLARALIKMDSELRKPLKSAGFLSRDPRMKERRKFGLKKARKAPQWSKR